jgi:hypothetical protein
VAAGWSWPSRNLGLTKGPTVAQEKGPAGSTDGRTQAAVAARPLDDGERRCVGSPSLDSGGGAVHVMQKRGRQTGGSGC